VRDSINNPAMRRTVLGMAALAAVVVVIDLLAKRAATAALGPDADRHSWWLIGDDVGLEYVRNSGAAFGLLPGNAELLGAISILIALGFAALILLELGTGVWSMLAGGLVAGGAIGNLIERVMDGFVTDYVAIGPWPRFNVADSAITVGMAVFILALVFQRNEEPGSENYQTPDLTQGGDARRDRSA
jgi:signal peptidase II